MEPWYLKFGGTEMRDYYIVFGAILAIVGSGFFVAWRLEVRERKAARDR